MEQYNLYNLEASFIKYLNSGNRKLTNITLKNYISDLRHFFGWFIFTVKVKDEYSQFVDKLQSSDLISKYFDLSLIEKYKKYLIDNSIPTQTSNRRLSTLRKLSNFFVSQRWISKNPASQLTNISKKKTENKNNYYIHDNDNNQVINEYMKALQSQNLSTDILNLKISDIKEFLTFS